MRLKQIDEMLEPRRIRRQERIRDLEQTLQDERRALAESEQRYAELERKYQDLLLRDLS